MLGTLAYWRRAVDMAKKKWFVVVLGHDGILDNIHEIPHSEEFGELDRTCYLVEAASRPGAVHKAGKLWKAPRDSLP